MANCLLLLSRGLLCLCAAFLVLNLALITPGGVQGDEPISGEPPLCGSHSACAVTCGAGVFPQCGTGTCNLAPASCNGCHCRLIYIAEVPRFCECKF